jgi:hypothetical protein
MLAMLKLRTAINYFEIFLVALTLTVLSGCSSGFPKEEARYKAKILDEKGCYQEAERLRRKAEDEPTDIIRLGPYKSDYDLRKDPYHFPEFQIPSEKRQYKLNIASESHKNKSEGNK